MGLDSRREKESSGKEISMRKLTCAIVRIKHIWVYKVNLGILDTLHPLIIDDVKKERITTYEEK